MRRKLQYLPLILRLDSLTLFLLFIVFTHDNLNALAKPGAESANFQLTINNPLQLKNNLQMPEAILIPEEHGWLISLLTPYIAASSKNQDPVQLLAVPSRNDAFLEMMGNINYESILSFIPKSKLKQIYPTESPNLNFIDMGSTSLDTSLQIARHLSSASPEIILSSTDDPERYMQAALLAAHYSIPLILFKKPLEGKKIEQYVTERHIKKIYIMAEVGPDLNLSTPGVKKIELNPQQSTMLIINKIGRQNVKNVILASLPNEGRHSRPLNSDPVSFIPYLSWLRNTLVVFSSSPGGETSERELFSFISTHLIMPRNITILGDYSRIESIPIPENQMHLIYDGEVDMEPAARPVGDKAIPFGVGRLPFFRLSYATLYYAFLLQREQKLASMHPRFTMISNLEAREGAVLFLAEAVSKATALELKNFRLKGKEFYRENHQNMAIWKAALASDLVIYEGHINQLYLLGESDDDNAEDHDKFELPFFDFLPFLILQSCNSLRDPEKLLTRGITGIIGSSTRVHSASGSSFIKAYLDGSLYQDLTVGEALRDAKNYFLSVVKLKELRGHKEQSKTMRVALTFRLWGDPESRLFLKKLPRPLKPTIKVEVINDKTLTITTPAKKHKQIKNGFYHLKSFPGSQTAGVVTSLKNPSKISRRINAFYSARVPVGGYWETRTRFDIMPKSLSSPRSVSLEDPYKRWIYFVHFPKKVNSNEKIELRLQ